jgi:hypothetical protein
MHWSARCSQAGWRGGRAPERWRGPHEQRRAPGAIRASDLLLDGLALLIADGYASGMPVLQQALGAFRGKDVGTEERLRWSWLAGELAGSMWDYDSWDVLTARRIQLARDTGALTVLPLSLTARTALHFLAASFRQLLPWSSTSRR